MPISEEEAKTKIPRVKKLFKFQEIAGIGIGKVGEDCAICVYLVKKLPKGFILPEKIDEVPLQVTVSGRFSLN